MEKKIIIQAVEDGDNVSCLLHGTDFSIFASLVMVVYRFSIVSGVPVEKICSDIRSAVSDLKEMEEQANSVF